MYRDLKNLNIHAAEAFAIQISLANEDTFCRHARLSLN